MIDTGAPAGGLDPDWLGRVTAWVDGTRAHDPVVGVEKVHVRPWSTVLRLTTVTGTVVWLKASSPGTAYEPALLAVLARHEVPFSPRPLAVDLTHGLTLLADGGATLRDVHPGPDVQVVSRMLGACATLQRAALSAVPDLLAAGVPDARPAVLPDLLDDLLSDAAAMRRGALDQLPAADEAALHARRESFEDDCALLRAGPVAASLQHDDLHDANVHADPLCLFDWGDAAVAHPFSVLLVALNAYAHRADLPRGHRDLVRLRDAYLEVWTDLASPSELRALAGAAIRVAPVSRALAWRRALAGAGAAAHEEYGAAVPAWLGELARGDLPLEP